MQKKKSVIFLIYLRGVPNFLSDTKTFFHVLLKSDLLLPEDGVLPPHHAAASLRKGLCLLCKIVSPHNVSNS